MPSIDGNRSKATSIKFDTPVSGGAYQDAREMSLVWNARPKHCGPPKIRGSMHPASPSTLFSPIFSLAREKIGPPEARQKRPRRNESLQARLLILCARFFLSKPQTEFAVWVFSMQICSNLSVCFADSSPGRGAFACCSGALRTGCAVHPPPPGVPVGRAGRPGRFHRRRQCRWL